MAGYAERDVMSANTSAPGAIIFVKGGTLRPSEPEGLGMPSEPQGLGTASFSPSEPEGLGTTSVPVNASGIASVPVPGNGIPSEADYEAEAESWSRGT